MISSLEFEQKGSINKKHGKEKDKILKAKRKETASSTKGKKMKEILAKKAQIEDELQAFKRIENIKPTFEITSKNIGNKTLVSILNGSIAYENENIILKDIYITINSKDRLLITGKNASGKTTLVKAILNDPKIIRTGEWITPNIDLVGYLDQHYNNLNYEKSVIDNIRQLNRNIDEGEIRKILSTFLFRTNEVVNTIVKDLSGGEKARLSLAQISVKTPSLLILDEITNNIDLITKKYIIDILKEFPGALIVISHDKDFVKQIGINKEFNI